MLKRKITIFDHILVLILIVDSGVENGVFVIGRVSRMLVFIFRVLLALFSIIVVQVIILMCL